MKPQKALKKFKNDIIAHPNIPPKQIFTSFVDLATKFPANKDPGLDFIRETFPNNIVEEVEDQLLLLAEPINIWQNTLRAA